MARSVQVVCILRPITRGWRWVSIGCSASLGKGNSVGFFADTMTDAMTQQASALLLALLRDHHPGEEAPPALVEAMGSYLRLNPDDDEMKEAWETFTVRLR
jgi:hypothetical protein